MMFDSKPSEEEDQGPSVDSEDPDERIQARRLRIQKRVEAERRARMGVDDTMKEVKEDLSKSRKQMEQSRLRLTKLRNDGFELVTNVRVAGDARENARRLEDEEVTKARREKLQAEATAGEERFDEITKKWETSLQKEIPQDLHEMLKQQQGSCGNMVDEKNKLIDEFQGELKVKDDMYVKDLKKQSDDIDLMIERMDEQVKNMTREYRSELINIERAFETERLELLEQHRTRWSTVMQQRRDKEVDCMAQRQKRVDDHEQQLQHQRVQDAEEYNQLKIKLETDVQILEQQLQEMRATYQLNQEKLEYNFQVLKKRDEENSITTAQQKRKLTRLQDVLNNLKIKLVKQEQQYRKENVQLTEDYKRITEQFKDLQKKSKSFRHFMAADAKKFHDVWVMNEEEAKELLFKAVQQDRLIHEHQLGLEYELPDLVFTDNVGPIVSEATKRKSVPTSTMIQDLLSVSGEEDRARRSTAFQRFSPQMIKCILELLCDESGFLVESKLLKLLTPLDKDEQSLMKLDAIFAALHVDNEEDVFKLASYFAKYTKKPLRSRQSTKISMKSREGATSGRVTGGDNSSWVDGEIEEGDGTAEGEDEKKDRPKTVTGEEGGEEEEQELEGIEDDMGSPRTAPLSEMMATELVDPNDCLKALRLFVSDNRRNVGGTRGPRHTHFQISDYEPRDTADDAAYWKRYTGVITDKKEKLWDALIEGLEQYSETLNERSDLLNETDGLRQQNGELRMLLHQYINSKVNTELEIPPTRILQLDLH